MQSVLNSSIISTIIIIQKGKGIGVMSDRVHVTMLGNFTLQMHTKNVDSDSNRMRKVWLLLAYLIYNRNHRSSQSQFLELICSDGEETEDYTGRLKALFYRARTLLNQLGEKVGHELIVYKNGSYEWNSDYPIWLDVEEFDRLCNAAAREQDEDTQLNLYLQAFALYRGDFLSKLSMESWVMPITAYYHQMYLTGVEQALALLETRQDWETAEALSRRALAIEPYSEVLYQYLMRCLIAKSDRPGARVVYEQMSEILFENFGVMPSEESRALYREASRETNDRIMHIGAVREQLREEEEAKGAVFCEYDFFKLLYQVQARAILRSGEVIHIALLSLHGRDDKTLSRRSLDCAMENLQSVTMRNLRLGDVVSRCSLSQLVIMLPQANYENSGMVCQRIIKAFCRQHPHSPAEIRFSVQPLEPKA